MPVHVFTHAVSTNVMLHFLRRWPFKTKSEQNVSSLSTVGKYFWRVECIPTCTFTINNFRLNLDSWVMFAFFLNTHNLSNTFISEKFLLPPKSLLFGT